MHLTLTQQWLLEVSGGKGLYFRLLYCPMILADASQMSYGVSSVLKYEKQVCSRFVFPLPVLVDAPWTSDSDPSVLKCEAVSGIAHLNTMAVNVPKLHPEVFEVKQTLRQ